LLKHRSELDEMMKLVGTLEDRLSLIEKRMMSHHHQEKQVVNEHAPKKVKRGPWRSFMNLFAF
jgi:chromosome-anchoring protein RacA